MCRYVDAMNWYDDVTDDLSSADVDECAQEGMCENGICRNTRGSFRCQCNNGYRATATNQACEGKLKSSVTSSHNQCYDEQISMNVVKHRDFVKMDDV